MNSALAYLAGNQVFLKSGDAAPQPLQSPFAQSVLDRETRDQQRNAWKSQGAGAAFQRGLSPWAMQAAAAAGVRRLQMTALARGGQGELLYALNTSSVGGLFAFTPADGQERRLLHRADLNVRDLSRRPEDGTLAMSVRMKDGTANLATLDAGGRGLCEITEGDSVDEAPAWVPGERRRLVFQSAGVARGPTGHVAALGPYAVQQLDLETGELTTLLEDEGQDFLSPRAGADGSLYYIRRPYEPEHAGRVSPLKLVADALLFPFRLARAVVHFFNFFSLMFAHKPLLTAAGPRRDPTDARHLVLWGKFIDAEKALKAGGGDAPALVPSSWQLVRRAGAGAAAGGNAGASEAASAAEEVLARGVLCFDLHPDGRLLFSNGSAVFALDAEGKPVKCCAGKLIEQVVFAG